MAVFQRCLEVGGVFEILLVKLFMAGLTGITSDVLSGCGVVWRGFLLLLAGGSSPEEQRQKRSQYKP